ncbi:MAG: hypothetical protein ABL889_01970 [Terricaulis sp.]
MKADGSKSFSASAAQLTAPGNRLLDAVASTCARLAPHGWTELFGQHGLDITCADLGSELARRLDAIDRSAPGFEDFSAEGERGVEPGRPAHSLLYHALASPQVISFLRAGRETPLTTFPTLSELEAVENYVYGCQPPSIEDLRARAQGAHLAIVVFATEYRPAIGTVHRRHADMCFARSGVSRVGTAAAKYEPDARGFLPLVDGDGSKVRVLPCRYAAYVAALLPGGKDTHGPLRFIEDGAAAAGVSRSAKYEAGRRDPPSALAKRAGDVARTFWIPLHKLFDGDECIRDRTLCLRLSANHINEKLRRAHLRFLAHGHFAGWAEPAISEPPFVMRENIAEFSKNAADGGWLLVPTVHKRLTEPAEYRGKPLTYVVPASKGREEVWRAYSSSFNFLPAPSGARAAPEYLHARHVIDKNGDEHDLNDVANLRDKVAEGGYRARHYVDFTGDGWIDVECSQLALDLPRRLPAYSIVASPDFFPLVDQTALMRWTDQSVLPSLLSVLWDAPGSGLPESLSDQRYAANLELPGANFDASDDTVTAIVGQIGSGAGGQTRLCAAKTSRASMLTDSAAGVFAPGWDVSYDRTSEKDADDTGADIAPGVTFLTNYGLGSPFMEDSKLCAALSSFWPAAAPDITRTFAPGRSYATSTPLTDEIIGLDGGTPWDGVRGPQLREASKQVVYTHLAYGDYVRTALDAGFDISAIARTTAQEYVARTLTMALVYRAIEVEAHADKLKWLVLSFAAAKPEDSEFLAAQKATGRALSAEHSYRFVMLEHAGRSTPDPDDFRKILVDYGKLVTLYADPTLVLIRDANGKWSAANEIRR